MSPVSEERDLRAWKHSQHRRGCETARRRIGGYLDGVLTAAERSRVDDHLSRCLPCTGVLIRAQRTKNAFYAALKTALGRASRAPDSLKEDVVLCLKCVDNPGSFRCPKLKRPLTLVRSPSLPYNE